MTYFPDLSSYQYVPTQDGDESDLNVGWLSVDHPYPTQSPDVRFVDALLRCCMRPVRLCMGVHFCDLACEQSGARRMLVQDHDGRQVHLGNGEVRLAGSDGRHYTAPTLVAHYVALHGYAPPEPFVEGVMRRAREIYVLRGESLLRLQALGVAERFALCLDTLQALQAQQPADWLADAILALRALEPALDPRLFTAYGAELARMEALLRGADRKEPIAAAARSLGTFFAWVQRDEGRADEATLNLSVEILERSHEAGLVHWREDMRPSRWEQTS